MSFRPLMLLALLAFAAPPAFAEDEGARPGAIVAERSNTLLATLVERRDQFRDDPAQLHEYVEGELREIFDREYSARLVLGIHGRGADAEAITAFAEALTDNLLRKYGQALLDVDPKVEVQVAGETPLRDGRIIRVASEIHRQGGAPVPVDYLFRETSQGWKVFDVVVEGVSYVQTYRNQFGEQLRSKSIAQVTRELAEGKIRVDE